MVNFNEIINVFELAVNQNNYFKGFGFGPIDDLDAVVNQGYPLFFVRPMTSPGLTNEGRLRTLTFEVYALDVPKVSQQDTRVALSNTEQGIYDVYSYFNDGPIQYDIQVSMSNIAPLNEAFQDRAVGWVSTITIIGDASGVSYCDIP